jgi:hypothetical protein
MNSRLLLLSLLCLPLPVLVDAADEAPPEPPPVSAAPLAPAAPAPAAGEQQQLYAPAAALVAPDQASAIVDKFRETYAQLGRPRFLIYVNRALVEPGSLKAASRAEHIETTRTVTKGDPAAGAPAQPAPADAAGQGAVESSSEHVSTTATYEPADTPPVPLADRQTVRDVERLFGRPLRAAGATLADQATAVALVGDQPPGRLTATSNEARQNRAALQKVADVVIEILISSRSLTVAEISGDRTVNVPDIQATAIRLKDAAILGQASATDVVGRNQPAGRLARTFDVNDIAEATALALMEDMTMSAK